MLEVLLFTLPALVTEYGFQSRGGIVRGFEAAWRPRRTAVRIAYWILVLIALGFRPLGLLIVVLGVVQSEIAAAVLNRRVRIDVKKGLPHGYPHTHFVPFIAGILTTVLLVVVGNQVGSTSAFASFITFGDRFLLVLFSIVALWGWATMITVSVVDLVRPGQVRDEPDRVGAGEVIGVLERYVTFVLVVSGAFTAVGFVIAAKAAARFPLFKEKAFAEYFLIGTLTSVGVALILGLLVRASGL